MYKSFEVITNFTTILSCCLKIHILYLKILLRKKKKNQDEKRNGRKLLLWIPVQMYNRCQRPESSCFKFLKKEIHFVR